MGRIHNSRYYSLHMTVSCMKVDTRVDMQYVGHKQPIATNLCHLYHVQTQGLDMSARGPQQTHAGNRSEIDKIDALC